MAAFTKLQGHEVCLYSRSATRVSAILPTRVIKLSGLFDKSVQIDFITQNLGDAVQFADLILVATTADAHAQLAQDMAPFLKMGQMIVLNPGRTLGSLEFSYHLRKSSRVEVQIGETQSLLFACREDQLGIVRIIGQKSNLPFAAFPASLTGSMLEKLLPILPGLIPAKNILETGLENIGSILHPPVILFNAAAIERGSLFKFYSELTPSVAEFIQNLDEERLSLGEKLGLKLRSASDWVSFAYQGIGGDTLLEKIRNNPAYDDVKAPSSLNTRMIFEDIPTGLVPMWDLGIHLGLKMPLMQSLIEIFSILSNKDWKKSGRRLDSLGIDFEDKVKLEHLVS